MENFIDLAIRTESPSFPLAENKFPSGQSDRLTHAAIGLATEAGEFLDAIKKHLFYNKPLDVVNLKEELGDILWYMAIAMHALSTDFPTEMDRVINKLRIRYPDAYSDDDALNRDLFAERKELEK